jgi:hypothetical protein
LNNPHTKIRESGISGFIDKGNRSASPNAMSISIKGIKGSRNIRTKNNFKGKTGHSPDHNMFNSSMVPKKNTFDYLQSRSLNKSDLNRTENKNDLEAKKYSESPKFGSNTNGAMSNLGMYQNKTFYTVNHPKRAGTTISTYQEDNNKRKKVIKKFRNKINVPNQSNSAAIGMYPKQSDHIKGPDNYRMRVKGNEKIFLPVNEVLNQARRDQVANNQSLSDIIKNLSSTRKNKPSLLENINGTIEKGTSDINKSEGQELQPLNKSFTHDEVVEMKKNLNLMNIQKSVTGSSNADKRELRPAQNKHDDFMNSSIGKKSNSIGDIKDEPKVEAMKLYNRTDQNNMKPTEHGIASRNNAYNSLVD